MYKRFYVFLTVISLLFATWTFPSFAETSSQEEQLDFDLEAEQNIKSINEAAPDLLDNKVIDKNEENNEENNGEDEIVVLNEQTALHSEGENVENNEENPGGNPEEEPIAVEENGYFLYKEDFSAGPYSGYGTTFDGVSEVPADKKLWLLNPNGGEIIYQNPSGVTWKISENPEYRAETSHGWVGFYKEGQGNAMTITGYGSWYKSLAVLDLGENIKIKDIADGDKQHINFSLKAASRMHAVALYVNDDSKSYILIGSANGEDTADYGQKTHYGNKTNYGGTGAMGVYLVPELLKLGYEVDVMTLDNVVSHQKGLRYIQENAMDREIMSRTLKNRYDAVVDFMVYTTMQFAERFEMFLESTAHYIFLSTYRVYADKETPIRETSPRLLDATTDMQYLSTEEYGLFKARCENILRASKYNNWTIVRPAITYSKYRFQLTTLEAYVFVRRCRQGLPSIVPEDALNVQATMSWGEMSER